MQRPDSRSQIIDRPTQPLMCWTAGITSSRTYAIASSIFCGSPRTVVDRAYMPPLLSVAGDAPAAPPRRPPSSPPAGVATLPGVWERVSWTRGQQVSGSGSASSSSHGGSGSGSQVQPGGRVMREIPLGVRTSERSVGEQLEAPAAGEGLDPVVPAAEAAEIPAGGLAAVGVGDGMVDVAASGATAAPGHSAMTVSDLDESLLRGGRAVAGARWRRAEPRTVGGSILVSRAVPARAHVARAARRSRRAVVPGASPVGRCRRRRGGARFGWRPRSAGR